MEFSELSSRKSLAAVVAQQIREAIKSGVLKPGDRLVERDLASKFGVSKTPVREALRELERQGLTEIRPRRGTFVRTLASEDIDDITVLRAALEGLALKLSLQQVDPQWIEEAEGLVEEMRSASTADELNDRHRAFHSLISSKSGNSRLNTILEGLRDQVATFISLTHLLYEDPDEMADQHELFITLLRSGDISGAQTVVDEHILADGKRLAEVLKRDQAHVTEATK